MNSQPFLYQVTPCAQFIILVCLEMSKEVTREWWVVSHLLWVIRVSGVQMSLPDIYMCSLLNPPTDI